MAKTVHGASQQWQKKNKKNCTDHPIAITHSMQGLPSGRASCYLGTTSLIIVLFAVLFVITIIIAFSIHHIYHLKVMPTDKDIFSKFQNMCMSNRLLTLFSLQVMPTDAGRYVCTLETFPKKSLFLLLQVEGRFISSENQTIVSNNHFFHPYEILGYK